MTIKLFIKWLQENFPQDATLVTTNSHAWFNREVEEVRANELSKYFFLKENPEKKGKPVKKPCLVIHDERQCDY
jgi:hypothetical protein